MNILSIETGISVIVSVALFTLGLIVLTRSRGQWLNRHYFLLSCAGSLWVLLNTVFRVVPDIYRLPVALLSYTTVALLALFFLLYSIGIAQAKIHKTWQMSLIGLAILVGLLSAMPGVIATGVDGVRIITSTVPLALYGGFILAYIAAGITIIIRSLRVLTGAMRQIALITMYGFVLSVGIGSMTNLLLPLFTGNYAYTQVGPIGTLLSMAASAYVIVRHRLFDIKFAAVRSVAYVFSLGTLAGIYFIFAYIASRFLFQDTRAADVSFNPLNIVLALVLAFIFQPIKTFFDRVTDQIFFRDRYDTDEFYSRLGELLATSVDLRDLLRSASLEISTTLKAEQAFFCVHYDSARNIEVGTKGHNRLGKSEWMVVGEALHRQNKMVVRDTLEQNKHRQLHRVLEKHNIAVVMQLAHEHDVLGYFVLGEQRSGGYSSRDIKVLETIADELVIAIQNALSIQEVRDLNVNLQERINEATRELILSNKKLTKLDETKDEFISMASHQLRTPLTSVKGYISMVLDGDVGEISKEQRMLLEQAFESSQRMVYLIGDFLNISRLRTGKFVLEPSTMNLAHVVEEEVTQLRDTARARGLTIRYQKPSNIPTFTADENKLRQVMMNFMDNAVYYTLPGGTIAVELYKTHRGLVFKVRDSGIGVPKTEQAKLFTKFFRAPNARKQRPDGTGIGLYMAKKVVAAHGGSIVFESQEGKGSTFGFTLPLVIDPKRFDRVED